MFILQSDKQIFLINTSLYYDYIDSISPGYIFILYNSTYNCKMQFLTILPSCLIKSIADNEYLSSKTREKGKYMEGWQEVCINVYYHLYIFTVLLQTYRSAPTHNSFWCSKLYLIPIMWNHYLIIEISISSVKRNIALFV